MRQASAGSHQRPTRVLILLLDATTTVAVTYKNSMSFSCLILINTPSLRRKRNLALVGLGGGGDIADTVLYICLFARAVLGLETLYNAMIVLAELPKLEQPWASNFFLSLLSSYNILA